MKKSDFRQGPLAGLSLCFVLSLILLNIIIYNNPLRARGIRSNLIITRLFDNYSSDRELKTGWGYSCLIQGTEKTILFDTGSCTLFGGCGIIKNMEKLKVDPVSIDVLFISHDHFDHVGGISAFREKNSKAKTFFVPHSSVEVCKNVFSTGDISAGTGISENALVIKTLKGLVVITGCAHPGVVNMVKKAKLLFPKEEVYLVMGGFHLFEGGLNIKSIIDSLKKENVKKVSPGHCTGDGPVSMFKEAFGADYIPGDVGKPIVIEGAFIEPEQ